MLEECIQNAEYIIQCAEVQSRKQKHSIGTKWKSLYTKLQNTFLEDIDNDSRWNNGPHVKHMRLMSNPLQKLCKNSKNLNRLILNLFPLDYGYSLMLKTSSTQYTETIQLPYSEIELLEYIDNEQIPPLLVETLNTLDQNMFHSGCVIAEIRDYRIATSLTNFETRFVLLRPTQQTLLGDVNAIAAETSNLFTWESDEKLSLESFLVHATSDPLCLAPSPSVQVMKSVLYNEKRSFKRHSIKRCIRRNGVGALLREKENRSLPTPEPLKLYDFLQKVKSKRKEAATQPTDIRLPKDSVDLWRKTPVKLAMPSSGIEVAKYAKLLEPKPSSISASDVLEVQQVLLRSESQNRDVYSRISIYQRPSDMQYFGKLQSNKYFQPSSDFATNSSNCSCLQLANELVKYCTQFLLFTTAQHKSSILFYEFPLGTEHRANLYILQYQELFAEDGRRPATVVVNRPLPQDKVQYQIPFVHQPWQLEQDKSHYAVGSINNIPVKHWHRLRPHNNLPRQRTPSNQLASGNPLQRSHSTDQNAPAVGSSQQLSATTPTLNAATLSNEAQSPFLFPLPQQASLQPDTNTQSPRQLLTPGPHTPLERKVSSDSISLLSNVDRTVFQLPESAQSAKQSRRSSAQDVFSFPSLNAPASQSHSSNVDTPLSSTTGTEGKIVNIDSIPKSSMNQSYSVNVQFSNVAASQSQASHHGSVQTLGKRQSNVQSHLIAPQSGAATAVLRVPTSNPGNSSGAQQLAINILGNSRGNTSQNQVLSNVQQIQLTSSSRGPSNTVSINASQLPAECALRLAAAANQLNQDKTNSSTGVQQLSSSTSGISTSGPITFVTNNNQLVGTVQPQQQQLRGNQLQSATLTFNPRTQLLTASVPGSNIQQPLQFLQVGSQHPIQQNTVQQLPIRIPGQQLMINPIRPDNSNQMTLTQHLQVASAGGLKRNRKRKATTDHDK